jgi:hypothetical protein
MTVRLDVCCVPDELEVLSTGTKVRGDGFEIGEPVETRIRR